MRLLTSRVSRIAAAGLVSAALSLALGAGVAAARTTEGPRADFPEFGLFTTNKVKEVKQPVSVSGVMTIVSNVKLIKRTRLIVGQLGRSFGVNYRVYGLPPGAVITIRTEHPKITHPETGKTMGFSMRTRQAPPNGVKSYTGFTFDHRYELAEGIWKFQILYKGKVIGEQSFKVVLLMN